jgi:PKD repeat protein
MQPFLPPAAGVRRVVHGLVQGITLPLLLVGLAAPALAQELRNPQEPRNLLANGSFENPPVAAGTQQALASAGAWSAVAGSLVLVSRTGAPAAFTGTQELELAALAALRQTCATRAGSSYALSLAYCPRPEAPDVAFEVWYAGSLLETVNVPAGSAAAWLPKSWLVTGASSQDRVELRALSPGALGVRIDDCFLIPHDPSATAQRLRNGNFEEDPRIDPDTSMSNAVFVGWYSPENRTIEVRDLGTAGNGASGKNVVDLDEGFGLGQRVYVVPDRSYTLRFAFSPNPADDRARSFTVRFGGTLVDTIAVPSASTIAWTTRSYTVRSEAPLATLEFQDLSGGFNGALLDAITLSGVVPEPETAGQIRSHHILGNTPTVGLRLAAEDMFARGVTSIGDLDGDGIQDLAVGAVGDDDGADKAGAVWILFMRLDKSVRSARKISELSGGLVADLQFEDGFGRALTGIGDLDADGVPDLAVGANEDDTGNTNAGAVYVLRLNRDGTVKGQHKITALSGDALDFVPARRSEFGASLAGMGDMDGDGIPDLAIGARFSNSVQTCFLRRDGTVRASLNVTYGRNGFTDSATSPVDLLGMSIANMGDFDGDGVNDLLVGAFGREFAGQDFVGGQYLWLMNRSGSVKRWFYYGSENMNPRSQTLGLHYDLGTSCAGPGDIDGDGVRDILSGAQREGWVNGFDREEGSKKGAVYALLLNANGTIKTCQRLGDRAGGLDYAIPDGARWGESMCALGDHDGNGSVDVAIGSRFDQFTGAVFLCELTGAAVTPPPVLRADFSATPTSGAAPLLVAFNDLSSGPVASWSWDFGDGSGSSAPNPAHLYSVDGVYTVRLTVGDGLGATNTRTATNLVTVSSGGLPPGVAPLGCGVNPAGSFRVVSGSPRVGTSMTFAVNNPLGTQAAGSIPRVLGSWSAPANRPCGTLVAGQGMSAPGANGELLLAGATLFNRAGTAWTGPSTPAPVVVPIPANPALIGRTLFVQGRLVDRVGAPIRTGLADGFALTLLP